MISLRTVSIVEETGGIDEEALNDIQAAVFDGSIFQLQGFWHRLVRELYNEGLIYIPGEHDGLH